MSFREIGNRLPPRAVRGGRIAPAEIASTSSRTTANGLSGTIRPAGSSREETDAARQGITLSHSHYERKPSLGGKIGVGPTSGAALEALERGQREDKAPPAAEPSRIAPDRWSPIVTMARDRTRRRKG